MATWLYYDYMGTYNPVCVDIGNISSIVPNIPWAPYTYHLVNGIVADGVFFGCGTKPSIIRIGGFTFCRPCPDNLDSQTVFKTFPQDIRHEDPVVMKPEISYYSKDRTFFSPICCDPRVLYIMHRAMELPTNITKERFNHFFKEIPSREKALAYLIRNNLNFDPIPFEAVQAKLQQEG